MEASRSSAGVGPVVLVVDDDLTMRFLCREALESYGYVVFEASSGPEALAQFEQCPPDLVLLDVLMEGLDGYETLERIRALPSGLRTPVVMTTGLDNTESIERSYGLGATDFITKPLNWTHLVYRVRYILRSSRTADALRDSQTRLSSAQRIARLGRWEWDLIADQMLLTDEVTELLGEFQGSLADFLRIVHPEDRPKVEHALQAAREHGTAYELDHRLAFADGEERDVHAQGSVTTDADGRPERFSGTIQNISQRKAMEQRLLETERLSAMGEMAGEIGHELNNYLMAISGRAELIPMAIDRGNLQKAGDNARLIADQVSSMRVLTDGLMESARSESSPEDLDLNELVARTLDFVKPQNKYNEVEFEVSLADGSLPIHADSQQIQQVILNLLSNGADSMHARPGSARRLRIRTWVEGEEVGLMVADDGVGMDTATLNRIFEPRFTTKPNGHGFGLAVCHRIIANHGGSVSVKSAPNDGASFEVRFPATAPRGAAAVT